MKTQQKISPSWNKLFLLFTGATVLMIAGLWMRHSSAMLYPEKGFSFALCGATIVTIVLFYCFPKSPSLYLSASMVLGMVYTFWFVVPFGYLVVLCGAILSMLCQGFTKKTGTSILSGMLFITAAWLTFFIALIWSVTNLWMALCCGMGIGIVVYLCTKAMLAAVFTGVMSMLLSGFTFHSWSLEFQMRYPSCLLWELLVVFLIFCVVAGSAALIPYMIQRHRAKRAAATLPPAGGEGEGA